MFVSKKVKHLPWDVVDGLHSLANLNNTPFSMHYKRHVEDPVKRIASVQL
jgi:hypothetical protein